MKISAGHLLLGAFVALSLAAVAGGFMIIGSPAKQRMLSLDIKRIGNLSGIASAIERYWERNEKLPGSLNELSGDLTHQLSDPETGEPYHYKIVGTQSYELCAVFSFENDEPAQIPWMQRFAKHGAGLHCYRLRAGVDQMLFGVSPPIVE